MSKKTDKKKYSYREITITLEDELAVKHDFVISPDKYAELHAEFNKAGVDLMGLLLNFAEEKKKILLD